MICEQLHQKAVVHIADNVILWINRCPVDKC